MWIHVPSFVVGSAAAGAGFLVVHRDLSHRTRLSAKWALAEKAESEFRGVMENLREKRVEAKAKPPPPSVERVEETWNSGVETVRQFAVEKLYGKRDD